MKRDISGFYSIKERAEKVATQFMADRAKRKKNRR